MKTINKKWVYLLIGMAILLLMLIGPLLFLDTRKALGSSVELRLSYYGELLSIAATAFIGLVALYQNNALNESNDKAQDMLLNANYTIIGMSQTQSMGYFTIEYSRKNDSGTIAYSIHDVQREISLINLSGRFVVLHEYAVSFLGQTTHEETGLNLFCAGEKDTLNNVLLETGVGQLDVDEEVSLEITLLLQSITGYEYTQVINADFVPVNGAYQMKKFNTEVDTKSSYWTRH